LANIKSAIKRLKQSVKRNQRNRRIKSHVKSAIKDFHLYLAEQDESKARAAYARVSKIIDQAVSRGVLHKNNGSRKKSRLARKLKQIAG
jgi:small subunit ribosomal protein S20